jgi:hypothetical protein
MTDKAKSLFYRQEKVPSARRKINNNNNSLSDNKIEPVTQKRRQRFYTAYWHE